MLALFSINCSSGKGPVLSGSKPVVRVNGNPITVEDFALEWNLSRGTGSGMAPISESSSKLLKRDLLDRMINQKLAFEAAKQKKIQIQESDVYEEMKEMKAGYTEDQFREIMADGFMTEETLARRVRERMMIERFFQDVIFAGLVVTREEAVKYYSDHTAEFRKPEKVRVQHIVAKTEDEILHILDRIKSSKGFKDVCMKFSEGPEAATGCELPLYARGEMPKVFDYAFDLNQGEVSDPVASPYGYHLFKLVKKYPPGDVSFEEVEQDVILKVLEGKKRTAMDSWFKKARSESKISIDQRLLESIP